MLGASQMMRVAHLPGSSPRKRVGAELGSMGRMRRCTNGVFAL
jgi:hypothetical protein